MSDPIESSPQWDLKPCVTCAGMQRALGVLKAEGHVKEDPNLVAPFAERQRLVNKPIWDAMEKKYQ